jgi:hypothetical protein
MEDEEQGGSKTGSKPGRGLHAGRSSSPSFRLPVR